MADDELTDLGVPASTSAVVLLSAKGENVGAHFLEVVDGVPLPKRQIAGALRLLATELERQADEADR